jgi:flagellar biosynthesis/type III secretory pathway protein FliH
VKSLSADRAQQPLELERAPSLVRLFQGSETELRESWRSSSLEEAFATGRRRGEEETRAALAATLDAALEEIETLRASAVARLAQDAAQLSVEIARELVRCETRAGRHDIERIVRETLAAASVGRGACVVHLHPKDAARLERVHFRARTQIEADPAVAEGDVHVTTPQGLLVRDLEHALDTIGERLRQELEA